MSGTDVEIVALELALRLEELITALSSATDSFKHHAVSMEKSRLRLQLEASQTKAIKCVLFGSTDDQENRGIFSMLDTKTQIDIVNVLRYFQELLTLHFQAIDVKHDISIPSIGGIMNQSMLANRIRWGFGTRKKMDTAIQELSSWNDRLFLIVQAHYILLSHEASGQSSEHASFLAEPGVVEATKLLSLNSDAWISRISTLNTASSVFSILLDLDLGSPNFTFHPGQVYTSSRLTATFESTNVLLESKTYIPIDSRDPSESTASRIKQLSNILHEMKTNRHHTLTCRGFFLDKNNLRYVLVLEIPPSVSPTYETLRSCFRSCRTPALEDRIVLARSLAMSLSQLFAVGWVHKSLSSDNIIFFHPSSVISGEETSSSSEREWSAPYTLGFEYARPETEFSSKPLDVSSIASNVYRHPVQWGLPTTRFSTLHDIYSFGVILLEIALWQPAISLHRNRFQGCEMGSVVMRCLIDCAKHHRIRALMGRKYQEVVVRCLEGMMEDDDNNGNEGMFDGDVNLTGERAKMRTLQGFNNNVVNVLDDLLRNL